MHVRKKTLARLAQHRAIAERHGLAAQMKAAGLPGSVRIAGRVGGEEAIAGPGAGIKRAIPKDYDGYDPRALKPLAQTLWSLSVALGHAMTAHRQFTKLKSATISPDGMLGGRGYVMAVKDVRQALHEACEALSTVSDTIHDEIHAPHWRPRLAELARAEMSRVERLVGEAEKNLDDPEDDAIEDMQEAEEQGDPVDLDDAEGDESGEVNAADQGASDGDEPPEDGEQEESDEEAEPAFDDAHQTRWDDDADDDDEEIEDADEEGDDDEDDDDEDDDVDQDAMVKTARVRWASSSVPTQTLPGPRVQHLERGDTDQTGPFGSYNRDEPHSAYDEWSRNEGIGGLSQVGWDDDGRVAESRVPDHRIDDSRTEAFDWGLGYGDGDGSGIGYRDEQWKSGLPNDGEPTVARSDYYPGDKGMNLVNASDGHWSTSEMPSPDEGSGRARYVYPGVGYADEDPDQARRRWRSTTHEVKDDDDGGL